MAYKNFKATEIIEEIGAELRKIRKEKNLKISDVSDSLKSSGLTISNTMLGRIEVGDRRIDDELFFALCSFYKADPKAIIIAASEEHIRRMSGDYPEISDDEASSLEDLYHKLNKTGQEEISRLMRLMAYMNAFKK